MKDLLKKLIIYYLTLLAVIKLKVRFKGQIIGIAGCYGKSSAVNLVEELLSKQFRVFSTNSGGKGLNSESGIPFAILNIQPEKYGIKDWFSYIIKAIKNCLKPFNYDFLILEMGVDKPDDMKHLTKFFTPDISILLNSNNTHSANFKELHEKTQKSYEKLIAYENGYIFDKAKKVIFYNLEYPEVIAQIGRFNGKEKYGFSTKSNASIIDFSPSMNGTKIQFKYRTEVLKVQHQYPLLDEYKSTLELAIKLAEYLELKKENLAKTIETFNLPASRCSLFRGIKETYILDSSYNSSLVPATSALLLLQKIAPKRKIAILGDMRELGDLSASEHNKLAAIAVKTTDIVITVGPMMKEYFAPQFQIAKNPKQEFYVFNTTKEALKFIKDSQYKFLQEDDTILVKGSQNTLFLEIIVENLLKDKSEASKLCRRDRFYEEKRIQLLA